MKQLTRNEIVEMLETKIENEKELEETYSRNHFFEDALRHHRKRTAFEELIEDIKNAEGK